MALIDPYKKTPISQENTLWQILYRLHAQVSEKQIKNKIKIVLGLTKMYIDKKPAVSLNFNLIKIFLFLFSIFLFCTNFENIYWHILKTNLSFESIFNTSFERLFPRYTDLRTVFFISRWQIRTRFAKRETAVSA